MANQLGKCPANLSTTIQPLRDLLMKENLWTWGERQQQAFDAVKTDLSSAQCWLCTTTALECGYSPAELLMGRQLRTSIPVLASTLQPRWQESRHLQERRASPRQRQTEAYDCHHRARPLAPHTSAIQCGYRTRERGVQW